MVLKSIRERFFGSSEEQFWKWFQANEAILYDFENNQEVTINKLRKAINKVHSGLTWEISSKQEDGKREFVISADGIKKNFPAVESLHQKAPKLDRWIILKYRPRGSVDSILKFKGKEISGEKIKYIMLKDEDPNKVGIVLFIPGFSEEESEVFYGFGFLFLDRALGEYDAVTRIGTVDFFKTDSEFYEKAHPLSELPDQFDWYFKQVN